MDDHIDDSDTLMALMRTAASVHDTPPAEFGHADVLATSHRITRRNRMIAAGAAGLVLIAGIGTATALPILNRNGESSTVAEAPRAPTTAPAGAPAQDSASPFSAGPAQPAPPGPRAPERVLPVPGQEAPAPVVPPEPTPGAQDSPPAPNEPPASGSGGGPRTLEPRNEPAQPGGPQPSEGSGGGYAPPGLGPSSGDCGKQQDPELRSVVTDVFPQASGASNASTIQSCRPAGERAVHLQIEDGEKTGILTVIYTPKGGASPGGDQTATTASGGRVGVSLKATGDGPAPFADEVGGLASRLAPQL